MFTVPNEPWHHKTNKIKCAHSYQSLHCPHEETLGSQLTSEHTAKTLIRLGGCPGWLESSRGAQIILLVLSWGCLNLFLTGKTFWNITLAGIALRLPSAVLTNTGIKVSWKKKRIHSQLLHRLQHTERVQEIVRYIWITSWENLFMPHTNNKGADHPRRLISSFVVRCLDSIIPLLAKAEISRH